MKKQILSTLKSLALALLLIAGVSYAWTGPTNTAPDGNVPAPINVGSVSQTKTGPFWANGLLSTGGGYFAGDVGIGTDAPEYKLHVSDRMKLDGSTAGLWVEAGTNDWFIGRSGTSGTNLRFYNVSDRVTMTPTGEVGIGDTAPDSGTGGQLKLDVAGNIGASQYCDASGNNCQSSATGFQRRVTGTCAIGSSIRAISADGTVTCETDDSGATTFQSGSVVAGCGMYRTSTNTLSECWGGATTSTCPSSSVQYGYTPGTTGTYSMVVCVKS